MHPFDTLGKYGAPPGIFRWYAGPDFEKLSEELEEIYREKVEQKIAESEILAVWVYEQGSAEQRLKKKTEERFVITIKGR